MNLFRKDKINNQILNGVTSRGSHSKKSILSKFLNFSFYTGMIGFIMGLFLMYGPYTGFRDWYITTAMTTMTHQYLATWFYSDGAIAEVLDKNKMIEIDAVTDPTLVTTTAATANYTYANEYEKAIFEKDSSHPDYKIINIKGSTYKRILSSYL